MYIYILCIYTHFMYILHTYVWQMGENAIWLMDWGGQEHKPEAGWGPGSREAASQGWALQRAVVSGSWAGNRSRLECGKEETQLQVGWGEVAQGRERVLRAGAGRGQPSGCSRGCGFEVAEHGVATVTDTEPQWKVDGGTDGRAWETNRFPAASCFQIRLYWYNWPQKSPEAQTVISTVSSLKN